MSEWERTRIRLFNVGGFTKGQRKLLDFHWNAVLLKAAR